MAGETINSLARGLDLLWEAANMGPFTLSEMARALGESISTVDRVIKTLADKGFLERDGERWQIGLRAAQVWGAYRKNQKLRIEAARMALAKTAIPGEADEWH
jgi:DNA-binding IclR family transcriptional regulator